ncbi:MAG: hypothetical protein BGN88_10425 [Clostridiales bacterium 43-6]|nr:MAG: hypothetical protein BGN88_10425 [Clostridiales bacterium 43-6]
MKRKLVLLTAIILSFSLLLTSCKQGDIGEAKAKEIALDYINKMFDANETEASVTLEKMECYRDASGALVTTGDGEFSERWVYFVRVPLATTMTKYEVSVLGSTGEVIYASHSIVDVRLTDEQKKQAEEFYAETSEWEEKHTEALQSLQLACSDWVKAKLDESRPIVLDANRGEMPRVQIRQFDRGYYVVTRDGRVYSVAMNWPSMQVLSIGVENAK